MNGNLILTINEFLLCNRDLNKRMHPVNLFLLSSALKSDNGTYIINGPWSVSPSGSYRAAGIVVSYQRGDKNRMESITATGPLNESLNLEIWYHEINPGVLYKYMLPTLNNDFNDNAIIAPPLYAANEIPGINTRVGKLPSKIET